MIPLLLNESLEQVRHVLKTPPLKWHKVEVTPAHLKEFEREAVEGAQFDRAGLKNGVWNDYKGGKAHAVAYECDIAFVAAILPATSKIPLDVWGRIFQLFGKAASGDKWKVFWFGATAPRKFPADGLPLDPQHLNGGYTTICSTRGIFIYRLEEATRVLIHEMLHAACLDPHDADLPTREATVETWAEVIFVALRAGGRLSAAKRLWTLQTQWVADTNHRAKTRHSVRSKDDYGWRYLNGREHVYQSLGLALPGPSSGHIPERSRFTHPTLGD